ncbi:MAG: ATP-binding protein [Chitinophagaceae bacterium]
MNIWTIYTKAIKRNCASPADASKDLLYWRNNLFAGTIIYLLPFCLIALIPGLYWSLVTGLYIMVFTDLFVVTCMVILAFVPRISIPLRKSIFIICVYLLSCTMLYYVGLSGSGQVYLLGACLFSLLILPSWSAYLSPILNTIVCVFFGLAIPLKILPWPDNLQNAAGTWIAVSSSTVFLSFLLAALIPRLFNGMEETIRKEKQMQLQLSQQQASLRQAVDMLRQKNVELEQFSYAASHDLQEPLRMITSFLTLLESKYGPQIDGKGKQYIYFAVDGAKRMRQMISGLLEFSRAGRDEDLLETLDLDEIINEVRILLRKYIEEKKAIIHTGNLPDVIFAKAPLKQIFLNLIGNALKYSRQDIVPEIRVAVEEIDAFWKFSISDNGIGVPTEYFDTIFIIFKRLHSNEQYSGTGIGLSTCKKIVEQHQGQIWIESEEGKGSFFYFTIPKQFKPQP